MIIITKTDDIIDSCPKDGNKCKHLRVTRASSCSQLISGTVLNFANSTGARFTNYESASCRVVVCLLVKLLFTCTVDYTNDYSQRLRHDIRAGTIADGPTSRPNRSQEYHPIRLSADVASFGLSPYMRSVRRLPVMNARKDAGDILRILTCCPCAHLIRFEG